MGLLDGLNKAQEEARSERTRRALGDLIQRQQYVGEVFSLGYEQALVLIHDKHRQQVGGIPSLSFLFATRIPEEGHLDPNREDTSILLLRVIDASPLPAHSDMERIRVEMAQRASGSREHWDNPKVMDSYTANELSFAGVKCRIVGTFYLEDVGNDKLELRFGSDISNYYPNQGLKVFKPREASLAAVVNFRDEGRLANHPLAHLTVEVGSVRYASTNRSGQGVGVRVNIAPADLVDQKTALFGMTRVGKSNTAKIIAKSIFEMRFEDAQLGRVGQLIFDYNGEYANENTQDANGLQNATALKNVWRTRRGGLREDVVTYGSIARPDVDPDRRLTKLNFYADINLQTGKEMIDGVLAQYGDKYIKNFVDVALTPPEDPQDRGAQTRYLRHVFVYRSVLAKAGFRPPRNIPASTRGLFGQPFRDALARSGNDPNGEHAQAAQLLSRDQISWDQASTAMAAVRDFISRGAQTGYQAFNTTYQNGHDGESWADAKLLGLLAIYERQNGPSRVASAAEYHSETVEDDFAESIYRDVCAGRLVIVDQSSGTSEVNDMAARRIMTTIFGKHLARFTRAERPPKILVYIEEAHNLLPSSTETDTRDIWVRTAKEGAKLGIGLVYSTQEVSSIQKNILKATANWFIGHLNNTEETRELSKYYDFADFEKSILRAQDKGFLRIKTLSNPFVITAQIDRFEVRDAAV